MAMKITILFIAALGTLLIAGSARPKEQRNMTTVRARHEEPLAHKHAEAKITVQNSEAKPFDQAAGPVLMEVHLKETFTGDIEGESAARALEVRNSDRSTNLVSMQRFSGKLGGRQGTFVLQGSETVENGKVTARWFVVPGSGTGELSGLRGEGGFEGEFGKGSTGTLDYWFE